MSHKKQTVKVLGAETDNNFWIEMSQKYPSYRDAWVELGRIDKIKEAKIFINNLYVNSTINFKEEL